MEDSGDPGFTHISDDAIFNECKLRYQHYFDMLDRLGHMDMTTEDFCGSKKRRIELAKVGAKPLSGVRGVYFSRGSWKVKYRDDYGEIVSCVMGYDNNQTLIATFDIAYLLLRKVISYGRQINTEDGAVIDPPTEKKLIALDNRHKRSSCAAYRSGENTQSVRTRYREIHRAIPYGTELDDIEETNKKKQLSKIAKIKRRMVSRVDNTAADDQHVVGTLESHNKLYKLTPFERKFADYSCVNTKDMLKDVMTNCRRTEASLPYMIESGYTMYDAGGGSSCYPYGTNVWDKQFYTQISDDTSYVNGLSHPTNVNISDAYSMHQGINENAVGLFIVELIL